MKKYIGYQPILNCCISQEKQHRGIWYFCRKHGWKHSDIKAEGEQLKIEI